MIGADSTNQVILNQIKDSTCDSDLGTLCSNFPSYVSEEQMDVANTVEAVIDSSTKSIVGFNVIINFLGGQATMYLWGLFRGMQQINNLNLIEVHHKNFT